MSSKIDQRIVEMSFENHKFEKGILESKNSLKDFSNALNGMGTGKEFNGLDRSVQSISSSFSALEQIGIGALRRIGAAAINAGTNMFKSLAIEPITQGFGEMELKMNSTQTIMASTGESLAVVNARLQELNEYSDKTIYSFSDMTQNIGKFTNAGVKLDMAVASIKGISNAAALAGANSNEASRAMYNFAQALSSGYVKLIDWKSIELANMATVEFKQQLLDSAVAAGTLAKTADGMYRVLSTDASGNTMNQAISATRNFNDSLSFQWMTTEALTKTLSDYADETTEIGKRASQAATQVTTFTKLMETLKESVGSGWAQTFEIIFGDFNEARDLWTGMNDVLGGTINTLSDARNALLSGGLGSGWKQFMKEGISDATTFGDTLAVVAGEAGIDIDNLVKSAGSMEKAVKGNWVTGGMLVETVSRMSDKIKDLSGEELRNAGYTEKTKTELIALRDALLSGAISADEFANKIGKMSGRENIIQGFKSAVVALLTAIKPISKAFDQIFPPMTVTRLYNLTEMFKSFTGRLIISEETANKLQRTFAGLFAVVDTGVTVVKFLGSAFLEIAQVVIPVSGGILDITAAAGDFLVVINHIIKSSGAFQYGLLAIKIAAAIARSAIASVIDTLSEFVVGLWNADRPLEYIGSLVQKIFGDIVNTIKMGISWISGKFLSTLSNVSTFLDGLIRNDQSNLLSAFLSIFKEFIDLIVDKATGGLKDFSQVIKDIDFSKIATFATGGVLLLFISKLTQLTGAMTGVVNTTNTFMTKFSKKLFGTTTKIKDLAFVVGILSASLYVLSQIPYDKLENGLSGLAKAMVIFVGAYAGIQTISVIASKMLKGQDMVKSAFNLVGIASGLAIMAGALKVISGIDSNVIDKSVDMLGNMMAFLIEYQILYTVISLIPGQGPLSVSLAGMAAGLLGLIAAVALLNKISDGEINTGIKKIGTILIAIGAIQILFGLAAKIGNGNKLSTSVMGMAGGILALIGVMKLLSVINTSDLSKGIGNLFFIGVVFAGIEVLFGLAGRIGGGKKFKTNMISISASMLAMIGLIAILGTMDQSKVDTGIVVLAKMGGIIAGIEILTALSARIAGGAKVQKILGSITITLLSFIAVIALLGVMDQSVIDKGIGTLAKMVGLIAAIQLVTAVAARASIVIDKSGNIAGKSSMFASLIGATIAIIALTGALALLSMGDQEALRKAASSLAIAAVAVGAMAIGVGVLVKGLSAMALNLTGFAGILSALLPGLVGLGAAILATVVLLKVIESVSDDLTIGWDKIGKFVVGLGIIGALVIGMALLGPHLSLLDATSKFVISGVVTAILGVGLIIGAFVLLSEIMALLDAGILLNGIDKLVLVGEGIGRFLGSIVGGFKTEAIIGYGKGLAGFADSVSGIKSSSFDGIGSLAKAMLTLTGASMLDGITRFLNNGLNSGEIFGQQLKGLIEAFSEISVTDATQTADILAALGPMTGNLKSLAEATKDIPNSGGFLGVFLGNNDMNTFGEQLKGFVNIFVTSLTVAAAQHTSAVLGALAPMANNLKTFANAASAIPNSGGFLGDFLGNNDINTFGSMLAGFINIFSGTGRNPITVEKATYASSIFTAMVPMATNLKSFAIAAQGIPNSGGLSGFIMGNNDLNAFGTKIKELVGIFGSINKPLLISASDNLVLMAADMMPALEKFATLANGLTAIRGTTLTYFAMELKGFVNTLSGVDFTVVQPALKSLAQINESFAAIGSEILVSAITSFENNKTPFQMAIVNFLDTTIKTVNEKQVIISSSFATLFQDAVRKSRVSISDFKQLGADLVLGLRDGIKSKKHTAVDAIADVATSLEDVTRKITDVDSPSKIFTEIGGWIPKSLGSGIKRNSKAATLAGITMSEDLEKAVRNSLDIHSESPTWRDDIFGWIPKSGVAALQNGKEMLLNEANKLAIDTASLTIEGIAGGMAGGEGAITTGITSLLDLLSGKASIQDIASELGIQTGTSFSGAYSDTIGGSNTKDAYKKAAKDAFEIFKEGIDYRKEYNLISLGEELAEWENFTKKYVAGSEIRMKADKEVARVRAELNAKEFDNSKRWIEEEKYYKRLSLLDELAAWNRVQKRYEEGHAYRIQAEKEMFRIKQEIQQAEYDNLASWIEDEKYYKRLSLQDELAAWTSIQRDYAKGTEQRKKADREVFRLQGEIAEKRKALEDDYYKKTEEINTKLKQDIATLRQAYIEAVESRAKSLYNSYKMFDAVEVKDPIDGEQLLTNLGDQVTAFEAWQQSITDLGSRGISEGLLNELKEMGPSSAAEIKALNLLTDEQLTQYVNLWQKKHQNAKEQATLELEGMRINTVDQIKMLETDAATQLNTLKQTFDTSMGEVATITDTHVKSMRARMEEDISAMSANIQSQFKQMIEGIKAMGSQIGDVAPGVNGNAEEYAINKQEFAKKYAKEIAAMSNEQGVDLGVAQAMLESEMRKNGMEGFTGGFIDQLKNVKGTGEKLASTAVNSLSPVVSQISSLLDDVDPTIRPVLDLTDIEAGSRRLGEILGDPTIRPVLDLTDIEAGSRRLGEILGDRNLNLSDIANRKSSLVSKPVFDDPVSSGGKQTKPDTSISLVQNNYSPKPLSRIEIYRQTKNQFSTLKGLVKD